MSDDDMSDPTRLDLQQLIDRAQLEAHQWQPRDYVGASQVGTPCERRLWYQFRWAAPTHFPARILRRFETGATYEQRVIEWLRDAGFEVRCENPRARNPKKQYAAEALGGLLRGHVDGFVRSDDHELWGQLVPALVHEHQLAECWHLLEVKAMASAKYRYAADDPDYHHPIANKTEGRTEGRWFETVRRGVRDAQIEHFAQVQCYMGLSRMPARGSDEPQWQRWGLDGPLDSSLYVAVNTDTDQVYAELVWYSPRWFDAILQRALRVIRSDAPPSRISENPASWHCGFCDYRDVCHGAQPLAPSCRTCTHAERRLPGDQGYYGRTAAWFCTRHRHGCGDYTACDDWSPVIEDEDVF